MTLINLSKPIKKLLQPLKTRRPIEEIFGLLVPLLVFAGVLTLYLPRWLGEAARYDVGLFGLTIFLLYFFTFRCPGRLGRALSLSALMITFALPLARLWHTGASDSFIVGGLLPYSDAALYYGDAHYILMGGTMSEWSPQRPLFSGLLVGLLVVTQRNLQMTVAIVVAMNAIACFFVAREIQKTHGAIVAALVSMQVFFFYRVYLGKTLTENLGLALGLLGFAVLWRSAHTKQIGTALLGLFFLAFALNARIGTVFVLPMVIIWGAYTFRRSARLGWLLFLGGGVGVVFLASTMNLMLLKQVGLPNGNPPFANFAYTLYGIATHTSWFQITIDHPELSKLRYVDRIRVIYDIAMNVIYQNPWRFVTGLLREWIEFFFGHYSWFIWEPSPNPPIIDPVFRPLAALGLWNCLRNWKAPAASLLLAMTIGAFLTIPLLPLIDAGVRPYAATIIILFTLSSLGFRVLLKDILAPLLRWVWLRTQGEKANRGDRADRNRSRFSLLYSNHTMGQGWGTSSAILIFGLILSLFSFGSPLVMHQFASAPPPLPGGFVCPGGQQGAVFRVNPGSGINLVSNSEFRQSNLPNIRLEDFREGLKTFSVWAVKDKKFLAQFPEKDMAIADSASGWLVAPRQLIPKQGGWVAGCGVFKPTGQELVTFQTKLLQPIKGEKLGDR